jgi:hypothetical protein
MCSGAVYVTSFALGLVYVKSIQYGICTHTTSCLRPTGHVGGASSALKLGVSSTSLGGTSRKSADTQREGRERGVMGVSDGAD